MKKQESTWQSWWRSRYRRALATSLRMRKRFGFTLAEMAVAIFVASISLFTLQQFIADGLRLQYQADKLSLGLALVEKQLAIMVNNPNLSPTRRTDPQEFTSSPLLEGMRWTVEVREETIDLAKVAETGQLTSAVHGEYLPEGVQNESASETSFGESSQTETGGRVEVYRIIIEILFPPDAQMQPLHVQVLQPALKTTSATGE